MNLFDYADTLPYAKGSPTSLSGAIAAQGHAEAQHDIVLRHIKQSGWAGMTMKELMQSTGIDQKSSMSRALNTLKRRGKIMKIDERPGDAGAKQNVYVAV